MGNIIKRFVHILLITLLLLTQHPAFASLADQSSDTLEHPIVAAHEQQPGEIAMLADITIARPILLGATIIGSALFLVSLPFSLLGGNVDNAANTLVVMPAKATFKRCLGCGMSN